MLTYRLEGRWDCGLRWEIEIILGKDEKNNSIRDNQATIDFGMA
jgi:hypothetical protein